MIIDELWKVQIQRKVFKVRLCCDVVGEPSSSKGSHENSTFLLP